MDLHFQDKIMLITGGERGIGAGIARAFAAEGGVPVITGRRADLAAALVAELQAEGRQAWFFPAELSDPQACQQVVDAVRNSCGRLDILVNNAGINDGVSLSTGTPEAFVRSVHQNLMSYFYMAHAALPMLRDCRGTIVNISSKTALTGQGGTSGYVAAKAGQLGLTREWAAELLPAGIRVNAIIPAEVQTPMYDEWLQSFEDPEARRSQIIRNIPLGRRMTRIEEIADAVLFLASDRASHITGQFWHVDGGYVHLDRALTGLE
ncbi:MAG: SDR family oxidoreductase [Bacteroidia bacterium]|nr:SDR family oxidoreductase [Bacteroidia bacterium]